MFFFLSYEFSVSSFLIFYSVSFKISFRLGKKKITWQDFIRLFINPELFDLIFFRFVKSKLLSLDAFLVFLNFFELSDQLRNCRVGRRIAIFFYVPKLYRVCEIERNTFGSWAFPGDCSKIWAIGSRRELILRFRHPKALTIFSRFERFERFHFWQRFQKQGGFRDDP